MGAEPDYWLCESQGFFFFTFIIFVSKDALAKNGLYRPFSVKLIHTEEVVLDILYSEKYCLYAHWHDLLLQSSLFHDTPFVHLSNYTALMCSFSPACLSLPPLMQ